MKILNANLVIFSVAAITISCKPASDDGTSTKALDQFAGSRANYTCEGSHTDNAQYENYLTENADARAAMLASLSALPTSIKDRVFEGGVALRIEAVSNITETCAGSSFAKAYKGKDVPYPSCHRLEGDGQVKIYVPNDTAAIRSSLVRAIGYYVSEIERRIDHELSTNEVTFVRPVDTPSEQVNKAKLSLAFLSDIVSHPTYSLEHFSSMLPRSVVQASNAAELEKAWAAMVGVLEPVKNQFADFVYAEAFDSYYCTDASRRAVIEQFPRTAAHLGLKSGNTMSLAEGEDASFGLQGLFRRWRARRTYPVPQGSVVNPTPANTTSQGNVAAKSTTNENASPKSEYLFNSATNLWEWYDATGTKTGYSAAKVDGEWVYNKPQTQQQQQQPVYYNSNNMTRLDEAAIESLNEMNGGNWVDSVIQRAADGSAYSGYASGNKFVRQDDGSYAYTSSDGKPLGRTATWSGTEWVYNDEVPQQTSEPATLASSAVESPVNTVSSATTSRDECKRDARLPPDEQEAAYRACLNPYDPDNIFGLTSDPDSDSEAEQTSWSSKLLQIFR